MGSRTPDHQIHGRGPEPGDTVVHPSSGLSLAVGGAEADQPDDAEHPRTWLAAYALGALDGDEREMVFLHVQRCDQCRAEVEAFASAAAHLAWAHEPVAVPLRVRAALLHEVDDLARRGEGPMSLGAAADTHTHHSLRTWPRLPRIAAWSLAPVAAALVVVMVVVMVGIINRQQDALQQAEEQQSETNRITLAASGSPAADTTFHPSAGAGDARARALMDRERNVVLILATNLPQPVEGEVYIAWLQISGTDEFARAAVLTIDEQGRAQAFANPPDDLARYSEMSITLEPSASSTYPTGPMLLTAALAEPE